jgi:ribosomal protein S18 acetylase RimI-like enzyme
MRESPSTLTCALVGLGGAAAVTLGLAVLARKESSFGVLSDLKQRQREQFLRACEEGFVAEDERLVACYEGSYTHAPDQADHIGHATMRWRMLIPSLASMNEFEVDEGYRRRGLGTDAYKAWERKLPASVKKVMLLVNNDDARRFWEAQGFSVFHDENNGLEWMVKAR